MIFITGASGFIGQALTQKLIREGQTVRILLRDPRKTLPPEFQKAEIVIGDLSNAETLADAMKGCTQVYHLAALARAWAPKPQDFDRANIKGTENILKSAQKAEVKRLVYTSTVMTLGPTDDFIADESSHFSNRVISHYQRTKIEAEKRITHFLDKGPNIIIASPGLVYGPGREIRSNSFNRVLLDYLTGKPVFIPGKGSQSLNVVYIDDVVDGLIRVAEQGQNGNRYILGGENIKLNDLEGLIQEVTGLKHKVRYVPFWTARTAGLIEHFRARLTGNTPRLTWKAIEAYKHSWVYSSEKAINEVGYRPRSLKEGIAQTCEWIKTLEM
ncbi:MAG TPA: NAD-dependent epimerase/dehydratase family protein [Nitrospiria bacterium]